LGSDRRQKHVQITDRGEPQPIDQGVAHPPEDDQAKDQDRDQDRDVFQAHAAASFP
jgi:hypothetical protein